MKNKKSEAVSILIVDDDQDLLFVLQSQLKMDGYTVFANLGGEKLIDQVITQRPGIVLLDLSMNMINGCELCRQIKQDNIVSQTKVIIMSGNHDIEKVAAECGADGFVAKPLSFPEIKSALERFG